MRKIILTHPKNLTALTEAVKGGEFDDPNSIFPSFEIRTSKYIDADKPTGKYILPGGKIVEKEKIRIREGRFIEYGPEDVGYLVLAGIIKEEREMVFFVMEEAFRIHAFEMPLIMDQRNIIITGCTA